MTLLLTLEDAWYNKIYQARTQGGPGQGQGQGQGQGFMPNQPVGDFTGQQTSGNPINNVQQQYTNLLAQSQGQIPPNVSAQLLESVAKSTANAQAAAGGGAGMNNMLSEQQKRYVEEQRRGAEAKLAQVQHQHQQGRTPTMGPPGSTPTNNLNSAVGNGTGTTPQLAPGIVGGSNSAASLQALQLQGLQGLQQMQGPQGLAAQQHFIQQLHAGQLQGLPPAQAAQMAAMAAQAAQQGQGQGQTNANASGVGQLTAANMAAVAAAAAANTAPPGQGATQAQIVAWRTQNYNQEMANASMAMKGNPSLCATWIKQKESQMRARCLASEFSRW